LLDRRQICRVGLPLGAAHLRDRAGRQVVGTVALLVTRDRSAERDARDEAVLAEHLGDVLLRGGVPPLGRVVRREPLAAAHAGSLPAGIASRRVVIRVTSASARSRRARILSTTWSGALPRNASLPS